MKYIGGMTLVLSLFASVNPLGAAEESISGFYALESLASVPRDVGLLQPLSDVQLANVEGSSRLHRFGSSGRIDSVRHQILTLFVFRLLGEIFRGNGIITASPQNNFLIQLNLVIGNYITQTNNAVQYNNFSAKNHLR